MKTPGFLLAAPASGSGKTAAACALMAAFQETGRKVRAFKCGPDYIDPMFHREVLGVESGNLDLFFQNPEDLRAYYERSAAGADLSIVEGVMGYYDGMGLDTEAASSYDTARTLGLPVILVLPGKGAALTLSATVRGLAEFRKDSNIRGILINRISGMLYPRMKEMLERELAASGQAIPVIGYLPDDEAFAIESRHLGLVLPQEMEGLKSQMRRAGEIASETVDLELLMQIASGEGNPSLLTEKEAVEGDENLSVHSPLRVGVARDAAFCFYYRENLELLERCGCTLIPFSPLEDPVLPEALDGLILGGGYPELYASRLSENEGMIRSVKEAVDRGMPCLAECGGFLYLQEELEDEQGEHWPLVGAVPSSARPMGKLTRFGYVKITAADGCGDGPYLFPGEEIRGHEFHYWDSTRNGSDCVAEKPDGRRKWECIFQRGRLFAGYPHLYLPSLPEFAQRFAEQCRRFREERGFTWEDRLREKIRRINPSDREAKRQAEERWKTVAKPLHSLGKLEDAVVEIAGIRGTADFALEKKGLVILCADNGVVEEGVTQTGQEVTAIVAENFTKGDASVCKMSRVAGADVYPYDIGMVSDVPDLTRPEYKVSRGTANMTKGPAMTREQAAQAVVTGIRIAEELSAKGYDILATGEMGIGNTTTSSAVVSVLLGKEVREVTGRGAGLSSEGLERKVDAIRRAVCINQPDREDVLDVLAKVGGLDIAGLTGVFLGGAVFRIPVVTDGFISSAAALCAVRMVPAAKEYMLASHRSGEPAGGMVLDALGLSPLIDCRMSLGEGSGAVAVLPLLEMGLAVYREMSTFDEIHVEQYQELT